MYDCIHISNEYIIYITQFFFTILYILCLLDLSLIGKKYYFTGSNIRTLLYEYTKIFLHGYYVYLVIC